MKNKIAFAMAFVISLWALTGCGINNDNKKASKELFAMDTYMTMVVYGEGGELALSDAEKRIMELDKSLDAAGKDNALGIINAKGEGVLDEDSTVIMERALSLWEETGTFDVAIYPVMKLWGFVGNREDLKVPEATELEACLKLCNPENISFNADSGEVSFAEKGMAIDFGGIAKGYTSAQIMKIFEKYEIKSGMVSLGGNIQVYGRKPDGSKWKIAIENPDQEEDYLGVYEACDLDAVVTSGGYERNFEENGVTYHHIIDPSTGYPANNGLISVTIISKDGMLADGLSTALYIMGYDEAVDYYRNNAELFDMILYSEEGELFVTEGIVGDFSSDLSYSVINAKN